jgi:hypothetical protein
MTAVRNLFTHPVTFNQCAQVVTDHTQKPIVATIAYSFSRHIVLCLYDPTAMTTLVEKLKSLATWSADQSVCLGWSCLPDDTYAYNVRDVIAEVEADRNWTRVSAERVRGMAAGATIQSFAIKHQGGYCPYSLLAVHDLPDGSQVAVFTHNAGLYGDVLVKRFSTGSYVIRIDVQGGRGHISVKAATLAGRVVFATAVPLTRWLNIKILRETMRGCLLTTSELGPFQDLVLVKAGSLAPLRGSVVVWCPDWLKATKKIKRRLYTKTMLVQITLERYGHIQ